MDILQRALAGLIIGALLGAITGLLVEMYLPQSNELLDNNDLAGQIITKMGWPVGGTLVGAILGAIIGMRGLTLLSVRGFTDRREYERWKRKGRRD